MSAKGMIGIDWGTSSFRAWKMTAGGEVLDEVASQAGILAVPGGDFEAAFENGVGAWLASDPDSVVVASGMITSRNGWCETEYLGLPVGAAELAGALTPLVTRKGRTVHFVTGVARRPEQGLPDVMRGEETELVGQMADGGTRDGLFVMPGTHSKWVRAVGGRMVEFETAMTGEVYGVMSQHSILGRLMEPGEGSEEAFGRGVAVGSEEGASLLTRLFSARTLALFGQLKGSEVGDYLSGLLIGSEVAAGLKRHGHAGGVTIIGRGDLAERYRVALLACGAEARIAAPGMARRGQLEIARQAGLI